jgi:hypothetical protein
MSGSSPLMSKQSSLITILPCLGVLVQSTLFGMCSGACPVYQGRQRMSVFWSFRLNTA